MEQPNKFGNRPNKAVKINIWCTVAVVVALVISLSFILCYSLLADSKSTDKDSATPNTPPSFEEAKNNVQASDSYPCLAEYTAGVLIEAESGRVLYAQNAEVKAEPASTTKILTAICVLENMDITKTAVIPSMAQGVEGSSVYLKAGERMLIEDLLYGLMLRSGNDAAVALALITSGSIEAFAKLMNYTAFKAGAYNSNFVNPHGLHDKNHYTTAFDLAKITAYAYKNNTFCEIVSSKYHYYNRNGIKECYVNKNKLLGSFEGANGVKTGYTKDSGRCLVAGAKRKGMQLISVVLNEGDMWNKSAELLNSGFENYSMVTLIDEGVPFTIGSGEKLRAARCVKSLRYPLRREELDKVTFEYSGVWENKKSKYANQTGRVCIKLGNHLLFNEFIYTM